jgi:long-subunit fatty acid transport protein
VAVRIAQLKPLLANPLRVQYRSKAGVHAATNISMRFEFNTTLDNNRNVMTQDGADSVGIGAHYRPTERWLLMSSFVYDSDPSRPADRRADMALDQQFRDSLGAFYDYTENLELGAAFVYANYGDARIENSTLRGEFKRNNLFFLNFIFNWKKTPWSS